MISTRAAVSIEPVAKTIRAMRRRTVAADHADAGDGADGEEQVVEALVVGERLRDRGRLLRRTEDRRVAGSVQRSDSSTKM